MEFDIVIKRNFFDKVIEYGIIKGSNVILLIKTGQDGLINGYNNKYLNLAIDINKTYGYTVISSSNPYDGKHNQLEDAILLISHYASKMHFNNFSVYYIGNSIGAYIGGRWGWQYSEIKKMLLINPPLFKNSHLFLNGLEKYKGDKALLVYSEYDPSIKFIGLIDLIENDKIDYQIIKGENHNFSLGAFSLTDLVKLLF